jgi:hypothetical protein
MRKLESSSGIFAVPICIAIGAYLLYGAWQSFADAKWPIYLPPQLDGIAFLASLFSPRIGAYIAGSIAGLLGALSCFIGKRKASNVWTR